jgi:S1-C subfamily serine protease
VAAVGADSPAARAGIRAGDVIVAIDGAPIADLRGYSACLAGHQPGDRVRVEIRRGADRLVVEVVLAPR